MVSISPSSSMEFMPTDEELVGLFLYNKIHKKPVPTNLKILEYDLYGMKNPWEIWEEFEISHCYGGKDLYFFTTLKKVSPSRSVRTIGLGSWKGLDVGKLILTKEKNVLGMRKNFRFDKSGTDQDGGWLLHEYSLNLSSTNSPLFSSHVLCRFRKKYDKHGMEHSSQAGQTRIERLAIPKPPNNNACLGKNIYQGSKEQPNGGNKTDVVNTPKQSDSGNKNGVGSSRKQPDCEDKTDVDEDKNEEEDDDEMSWPELFSKQLRETTKECLIKEEEVQMLPNDFAKDILSEYIDMKYLNK